MARILICRSQCIKPLGIYSCSQVRICYYFTNVNNALIPAVITQKTKEEDKTCTCSPRQARERLLTKSYANNAEKPAFHVTSKGLRRSWSETASATGRSVSRRNLHVRPQRWFAAHRLGDQRNWICFYFLADHCDPRKKSRQYHPRFSNS